MRIGIAGCGGRMGRALIREVLANKKTKLSGGFERPGSELIGMDLGALVGLDKTGLAVKKSAAEVIAVSDAIVNFTSLEATMEIARMAAEKKKIHVIGTTGLDEKQKKELQSLAKKSVIVHAHNMSVGVNLLLELVREVAEKLPAEQFDIEILEMHHNQKVDAPSGTALSLGEAAAKGRGVKLKEVSRKSRDGIVGKRPVGEIGFATLRGGSVVGDHTVIFASNSERLELTHKASDRAVFASGAVRAALWAKNKKSGMYTMLDVLGIVGGRRRV